MRQDRYSGEIYGKRVYLARIDKRKARNLFERGVKIYLAPSNFRPIGVWFTAHEIDLSAGYDFDTIVNSFDYYNCINHETGYFPSYFINLLTN